MATEIITVSKDRQIASATKKAVEAVLRGDLVGFPTETVYGIAALANSVEAMGRLRELKSRPDHPFSLHLGRPRDVRRYVSELPESARRLVDRAWPGPITLIVPFAGQLPDPSLQNCGLEDVLSKDGWLGLRCPDEPIAQRMLKGVAAPVVAPSANLVGKPSPRNAADVLGQLDGQIDLLVDHGPTRCGGDSTIVRCDGLGWHVLREGVVSKEELRKLMLRTLLFVCTGNTCRSPMAAALARRHVAGRMGCGEAQLPKLGVEISSAGIAAVDGQKASREAMQAMHELGVSISRHRSRRLTPELIHDADMILCMTDMHVEVVLSIEPTAEGKVMRLEPSGPLSDPIGGGSEIYRRTAEQIQIALEKRAGRELP